MQINGRARNRKISGVQPAQPADEFAWKRSIIGTKKKREGKKGEEPEETEQDKER